MWRLKRYCQAPQSIRHLTQQGAHNVSGSHVNIGERSPACVVCKRIWSTPHLVQLIYAAVSIPSETRCAGKPGRQKFEIVGFDQEPISGFLIVWKLCIQSQTLKGVCVHPCSLVKACLCQANLTEVVLALRSSSSLANFLHRRQE